MDIENNSRPSDENTSSDKMEEKEIEITGEGDGPVDIEENQMELEKLQKREMEKKKFLEELKNEVPDAAEGDKDKAATQRMKYLLKQAEVFAHFVLSKNEKAKKKKPNTSKKSRSYADGDEDEDLLTHEKEELEGEDNVTRLTVQPSILKGGKLKDYQLNGLNWLINLFENGVNGILADEMGLGKTIQTISLIAYLKEFRKIHGPFLIIGPKSVMGNWFREFQRWLPMVRVLKLIATKAEREEILANHLKPGKFDVCLTSYEGINICKNELKKFHWKYIIIDEAHKIKNEESLISRNVREFKTHYKLLLTGTPLQNNLHELWSLLNFLLPDLFASSALFDQWFEMTSTAKSTDTETMENTNMEFITQLHKILKPFLLRRTKTEVEAHLPPKREVHLYVGLTETQVNLYKTILSKKSVNDDKKAFINILMQLRKVCNHPYLFEGVEEEGLPQLGAHLINVSGKMIILDKLLAKLKKENHQVLIFSQMTSMLDILEDYCNFRGYKYCRIDGNTDMDSRDRQICEFVEPNSEKFIFLLSTRAGGLGINLATADTVILYDSDWNPQVDLQAMDRAHRIGQKNPVMVYRMITEKSLEEKIVERQMVKLKWDTLVIQQGRFQQKNKVFTKDEIKDMIQFGASEIFRSSGTITDEDIDILLERGERKTQEQNSRLNKLIESKKNILDLAINDLNFYEFEDVDYQKKKRDDEIAINEAFIAQIENELRTRREKRLAKSYNLNEQFNNMINANKGVGAKDKKIVIKLPEFQFYENRERLVELLTKQAEWEQAQKLKALMALAPKPIGGTATTEQKPEEAKEEPKPEINEELEKELAENHGLTKEEKEEKEKLISTGFVEWNKDEFHNFVRGCEKFGRKDYKAISEYIGTKTPEEVQDYANVFWARITELPEYEKIQKNIERGENQIQARSQARELIVSKCSQYKNPKEELEFNMVHYNKSKSKFYSLEHDKFLIYACYLEGFGNWDKVRMLIKREPLFRFDHFFKSRTESELHKRVQSLLKVLEKEKETATTSKAEEKEGRKKLKVIEEESDDDKFLIKKKSSAKKKQEESEDEDSVGSEEEDEKNRSAKKTREDRYKEREILREKATLEKYEKMKEKKKNKEEKKMKQTSILSFSNGNKDKTKKEEDESLKQEDGAKIEEKIEPKEEDNVSEGSKGSDRKVKKRRKHEEVSKGEDDIESHNLKATKVTAKEEATESNE